MALALPSIVELARLRHDHAQPGRPLRTVRSSCSEIARQEWHAPCQLWHPSVPIKALKHRKMPKLSAGMRFANRAPC